MSNVSSSQYVVFDFVWLRFESWETFTLSSTFLTLLRWLSFLGLRVEFVRKTHVMCQSVQTDSLLYLSARETNDQPSSQMLSEASPVGWNHDEPNVEHFSSWLISQRTKSPKPEKPVTVEGLLKCFFSWITIHSATSSWLYCFHSYLSISAARWETSACILFLLVMLCFCKVPPPVHNSSEQGASAWVWDWGFEGRAQSHEVWPEETGIDKSIICLAQAFHFSHVHCCFCFFHTACVSVFYFQKLCFKHLIALIF